MTTIKLHITGITCNHCVATVTKALEAVPGVQSVAVNLDHKQGVVMGTAEAARLVQAVEGAGYEAKIMT